jgi:hypothetical protein
MGSTSRTGKAIGFLAAIATLLLFTRDLFNSLYQIALTPSGAALIMAVSAMATLATLMIVLVLLRGRK